ncbi:hypothetical protein LCGC14_2803650, partial [marine sediment metagenome]
RARRELQGAGEVIIPSAGAAAMAPGPYTSWQVWQSTRGFTRRKLPRLLSWAS